MNEMLVTIITPSFNQGKYIEETIQSVLNQTYNNIEYIIVDGCSTDETIQILNKYKNDARIDIIVEKDNGQTDAINKGFRIAKGKLVGWINSDDILKKDCVENIVNAYEFDKNAAIFYGNIEFIDENSKFIMKCTANKVSYNYLLNVNPDVNQQGSFYNLDYVKKVGYLDDSINFTMDYDLWLRLLKISSAINLNKVVAEFRMQTKSKTMTSGNGIKFWKDIFSIRNNKHKDNEKMFALIKLKFVLWIFTSIKRKTIKFIIRKG